MPIIRELDELKSMNDISILYISLDVTEGGCVGHWIWECALFLPHIKNIQNELLKPIKIILYDRKQYKINILSDFGFNESDIEYSTHLIKDGIDLPENFVSIIDTNHVIYAPKFFYLWNVLLDNTYFYSALNSFRKYYIDKLDNTIKTIDITYVARSKKENYFASPRTFNNNYDFQTMLEENNVNILNVDSLYSFQPQVEIILKSNIIIVEMGSAFTVNAFFIAENSHIIIINDFYNYHDTSASFFKIFRKIIQERNNTVEIFSYGKVRESFNVDIDAFKNRINIRKAL